MSTSITMHGGIRVIGGTKALIETETVRLLLDIGLDIPEGPDLFRAPVAEREGRELADRLLTDHAPWVPGLYDPAQLRVAAGTPADRARLEDLAQQGEREQRPLAVVLSHAHIDHDGLLPFLDPAVPVYAHPDTITLHRALEAAGSLPAGGAQHMVPLGDGESLQHGELQVSVHRVDHDVRGAVGTLVRAPEGLIAYTGDISLHCAGGHNTRAFLQAAHGADVLICETTMLSFDPLPPEPADEATVMQQVRETIRGAGESLVLLSAYERDVDRCAALMEAAAQEGRAVIWPGMHAAVLTAMGVQGVHTWAEDRPQRALQAQAGELARRLGAQTVPHAQVCEQPSAFVVQTDAQDAPALLDLPLGEGTVWIHSQGEPLGPFMADWQVWQDWLSHVKVPTVRCASSGHAGPLALREIVETIAPQRVLAVHGFAPERLEVPGCEIILPEQGEPIAL